MAFELVVDGKTLKATYGYDANDNRIKVTYPQSATVVDYTYDALGRQTKVNGYINAVTYWPSGQVKAITYANGQVQSFTENNRLMVTGLKVAKGTSVLLNSTYTYDALGNVSKLVDTIDATQNRTLTYDNLNRLATAAGPWGAGTFTYDAKGNITTQKLGTFSLAYAYDAQNRLSNVTGSKAGAVTHDGNGNMVKFGTDAYTFNTASQLTCVNCANATIKQAYSYGADGNRVMVTKGAAKTYEFVGADGQQLLGFEAATNKLTDYIYLGDVKIAQKEKTGAAAAVVSYLHNDLLGSPILSTNAAGATLWKETYQPYGAPHVKSVGKVGRQTGYLGKPYEEATGLSYLGARYYNPMLGRFLSIDPVGIVPSNIHSPNRYAYANNNPLTYKDPRGQLPIVIPIIIIGSGIVSAAIASSQGNDSSWTGFDKSFSKFWQNYIQDLARDLTPKPILNENSNAFNDNQDLTNTDNLDVSSSEMLPNDEDPGEDNGNQAKKLSSKEIGQKVERGDWHKTKLKSNLQKQYSRELRGSKNFDIYQNKETGNFFIQGNKSGNRIYIGKDLKNYL